MKYEIEYTVYALNDLNDIYEYIANQLNVPETAKKIREDIIKAVNSLETFPFRFQKIKILSLSEEIELRSLNVHKYRIFYQIDSERSLIFIIRILYEGRDITKAFSELDLTE